MHTIILDDDEKESLLDSLAGYQVNLEDSLETEEGLYPIQRQRIKHRINAVKLLMEKIGKA